MTGETYQAGLSNLEATLVDICRMGVVGDSGGVRAAARRLIRKTPGDVTDSERFRQAVGQVLAGASSAPAASMLRRASTDDLPLDNETAFSLATIAVDPEARPAFSDEVAAAIDALIAERERAADLEAVGLSASKAVLFTGPPGVGKTMTARYVATRLGLPLVTIDLATVMSSYLGRTGQNLRAALRYGRDHACVVFIDEFDALAKRRDDDSDIGELKRLVNVLLLELERWPSTTLLVAATNHAELLDRAMARRFDRIIEFGLPDANARRAIVEELMSASADPMAHSSVDFVALLTDGLSGSDIHRLLTAAMRRSILDDVPLTDSVTQHLASRAKSADREMRDRFCVLARNELGWSNRRIAELLGVTHPTVAAALRRVDRAG